MLFGLYKICFIFYPCSPQPKKYVEYSLKSPGIKPSSHRHASSSKIHGIPPNVSVPKSSEEDDSPSPMCITPPTPSTPQTPPSHGTSLSSVFPGKDFLCRVDASGLKPCSVSVASAVSFQVRISCVGQIRKWVEALFC